MACKELSSIVRVLGWGPKQVRFCFAIVKRSRKGRGERTGNGKERTLIRSKVTQQPRLDRPARVIDIRADYCNICEISYSFFLILSYKPVFPPGSIHYTVL